MRGKSHFVALPGVQRRKTFFLGTCQWEIGGWDHLTSEQGGALFYGVCAQSSPPPPPGVRFQVPPSAMGHFRQAGGVGVWGGECYAVRTPLRRNLMRFRFLWGEVNLGFIFFRTSDHGGQLGHGNCSEMSRQAHTNCPRRWLTCAKKKVRLMHHGFMHVVLGMRGTGWVVPPPPALWWVGLGPSGFPWAVHWQSQSPGDIDPFENWQQLPFLTQRRLVVGRGIHQS